MKLKRKLTRFASSILCALLLISSFTLNLASAQTNEHSVSYLESQKDAAAKKVNKSLIKKFDDHEMVSFLIKFKDQVDTVSVAKDAEKKAAAKKLTAAMAELAKRSTIVSELRAKAKETQVNLLDFLQKQENAGKAKDVKSFYIVNGIAVTATKDVMEKIASYPEVESVTANEIRAVIDNETIEPASNQTNSIEWGVDRIGAPASWQMGIDGTGIVVANIDTGVQWNHPALMEKYRGYNAETGEVDHEFNWYDPTNGSSTPNDFDGHGTHTMGTMVGSDSSGSNQIGVAPGAKWIAVGAFGPSGATDVDLLAAGEWILAPTDASGTPHPEMAPDVVNNSWGSVYAGMDEWFRQMVQTWRAADIVPVFAAGNVRTDTNPGGPGSVSAPGNYPESFAVGATDIMII